MKGIFVLAAVMAFGLVACAPRDVIRSPGDIKQYYSGVYDDEIAATVEKADWSKAIPIKIRIRQNDFDPMVFQLRVGTPYVLTIENADPGTHSFLAKEFFANVAVKSLEPLETPLEPGSAIVSISLEGGQTRTVALVPTKDGTFEFEDGYPGIYLPGAQTPLIGRGTFGGAGYVIVKP